MAEQHPTMATIDQLSANLAAIFSAIGINESDVLGALSRAFSQVSPSSVDKTADFELTKDGDYLMSTLIYNWASHPEFVDERGSPMALLPLGDSASFEALYDLTAKSSPEGARVIDPESAIKRLLEHNVIEIGPEGSLTLLRKHFPSSTKSSIGANMALIYINDYVSTARHNFQHARRGGRFQRVANARAFPKSMLPVLNALVEETGMQFLHQIDDCLMDGEGKSSGADADTTEVGVGFYLYIHD